MIGQKETGIAGMQPIFLWLKLHLAMTPQDVLASVN